MRRPELERSAWDRFVRALAHPVRALAWLFAVGATLGPFGGPSWILVGGGAALTGIVLGELLGRSRLRLPVVFGGLGVALVASTLTHGLATRYALVPSVIGPVATHWLGMLLSVGVWAVALLAGSRVLARRGPAFDVVELGALTALLAGAVASHRGGSVARPLWLTDVAWSFGIDPGHVLLGAGAVLTGILAGLLLLGSERRKPTGALLMLPLLALVALAFVQVLPDQRQQPPQVGMDAMGDDDPSDGSAGSGSPEQGDGGGQGDQSDGQGGAGEGDGDGEGGSSRPDDQAPDPMDGSSGGENTPVAVLLLDDDHVPPSGYWYLRQDVLPAFNGTRLVPSTIPGAHADVLDHFAVEPEQLGLGATEHRKTIRGSLSLVVDHPTPFAPANPVAFAPRGNPNAARFVRSYQFASAALTVPLGELLFEPVGDPTWSAELTAHLLETPDDPRYAELANEIVAQLEADVADQLPEGVEVPPVLKAAAVAKWIGDNMQYSKREKHANVPDPTADFLFGNRIGYCVHTAHAAAYLWRTLGIPARVATGYAEEERFRRGGTLVVMGGSAHAWPELYLRDVGWVPLDVAPAVDLDATGEGLPPDEDELRALGDLARDAPDLPGPRPDYTFIKTLAGYGATAALLLLVGGLLGLHWLVKAWRRTGPLFVGPPSLSRVGYRAALDLLADAGHVREPGETREAFARRLEPEVPALTLLTDLHLRGALGRPGARDPERDRTRWTGLLARLRHELRQSTPLWRRLIGFFDPSTPYRSR